MSNYLPQREAHMSYAAQEQVRRSYYRCPHYDQPAVIDTCVAQPSYFFREMPSRIISRTCSAEFDCILMDKSACPMRLVQIRNQILN